MAEISINQSGDNYTIDINIQDGDCLWTVAEEVSQDLQKQGMKVDKDVIFQDLSHDPHFKLGSDNGVLPSEYQGGKNQPMGTRDLDLIYAGDKFKIDLTKKPVVPTTTEAPNKTVAGTNAYIPEGTELKKGGTVTSPDGNTRFEMGQDGYVHVSTKNADGTWTSVWSSQGKPGDKGPGEKAVFQTDGNIVVLDASGAVKWSAYDSHDSRWKESPQGKHPQIAVQNDGNVVIVYTDPANGQLKPIWDTKTEKGAPKPAVPQPSPGPSVTHP